jgi:DNA repair protein RadD
LAAGNTARHGPIDTVDGRKKEKSEEPGEAPIKVCPECQTINHAAAKHCASCNFEFPAPASKIAAMAATDALLSTQIQAEWIPVKNVIYSLHSKPGKPSSMRVSYMCGLVIHSEWICFDHIGYPRQKAESWWKRRSEAPIPANSEAAMATIEAYGMPRKPTEIQVRPVGKYVEITGFKF